MPKFSCSICWHNESRTPRTSPLKERRMTWTIEAETAAQAITFMREWVMGRPINKGRKRRIVFVGATMLGEEVWARVEARMRIARPCADRTKLPGPVAAPMLALPTADPDGGR